MHTPTNLCNHRYITDSAFTTQGKETRTRGSLALECSVFSTNMSTEHIWMAFKWSDILAAARVTQHDRVGWNDFNSIVKHVPACSASVKVQFYIVAEYNSANKDNFMFILSVLNVPCSPSCPFILPWSLIGRKVQLQCPLGQLALCRRFVLCVLSNAVKASTH